MSKNLKRKSCKMCGEFMSYSGTITSAWNTIEDTYDCPKCGLGEVDTDGR